MLNRYKFKLSTNVIFILIAGWILYSHGSLLSADDLRGYPTSIVFNEIEGNTSSSHRSVFLFTTSSTVMNWTLTKNTSWITTDLTEGVTEAVLRIGVNSSGLPGGLYNGNVVIQSAQSSAPPVVVSVALIVNPDVGVTVTTWKDGYEGAMSISIDSRPSGFALLQSYGFKATYFFQDEPAASYLTDHYNAGMEIGSHTINHPCFSITDDRLKYTELEPNIQAICSGTPQPCNDLISFAWPCGFSNYREQSVTALYFLSSRGYNFNQLEDATPENFMNLKSYNSHEHEPYPPDNLRPVIDAAVAQKKWLNMVWHQEDPTFSTDVAYAATKNIWVAAVGTVTKYILQRDRFILTNYNESSSAITFNASRLGIPPTVSKTFEQAFGQYDLVTIEIDIDNSKAVENVYVNGAVNPYQIKNRSGNLVLLTSVRIEPGSEKTIEVKYVNTGIGVTVTGVTALGKVYNNSTAAIINTEAATLNGVLEGDTVILDKTGAIGSFTNKNVGTGKTVMTSGFILTGPQADKYALMQPTAEADITPVHLTISGVSANSKVYDRTTVATLNTNSASLSGVVSGDYVSLVKTAAIGTFSNRNVGTSKTVTVTGFYLAGIDAGNYTFTQPSLTASITRAPLTITGVTASNKIYDGTTTATINVSAATLVGVISGDAVTLITSGASGNFEDEYAGVAKPVYTSGFSVTGTDNNNYSLTQPTLSATIIGITLTITGVTANSKVYNGNTVATLNTGAAILSGVIPGDIVTLVRTGAIGTFDSRNTGTGKSVTTSGFTLIGADAGKYSLTQPVTGANITPAALTISGVTVSNKVYNGTTAATLNTGSAVLGGVVPGDAVNLITTGATGTFSNDNAGTAKTVTMTGFTIGGTDSGNYTLTQPSGTANITAAPLNITGVSTSNKVYNASTSATLNTTGAGLLGVISGDAVNLVSTGASAAFANKNAGTGKTVTTTGFTISGADVSNYSLVQPSLTANITPAILNVSGVIANNKVYNGTTSAVVNGSNATLTGVLGGDIVTLVFTGATGTFVNKNTGTNKAVTIAGITLGGTDAGNYTLVQPAATANITSAPLAVTWVTAGNKTYDGTTAAALNTSNASLSVVFGSDNVTLSTVNASGTFSDKNTGTGKIVTTSGFSISGTDAFNYILSQPTLTANILSRTLTVTANDQNKPYKTTLTFTGSEYTQAGLVAGDILPSFTISSAGAPQSAAPGEYAIIISGGSMPNYNIERVNGLLSVGKTIVTARADNKTRTYGSANPAFSITWSGFLTGDDVSDIDAVPSVSTPAGSSSDPGIYPVVLSGGSDDMYAIKLENGVLEILKAPLTVTADNISKIYGEPCPELTISYSGFVLGQDQRMLDRLPVAETETGDNSDAGEYDIILSGAADNDYTIIFINGILTVNKEDQEIVFENLPSSIRMTEAVTCEASASSGLPVEFRLSDPHKATMDGNVLTVTADGELIVTAVQEGDRNHNPATEVSQVIDVLPTFDNISSLFTPNADGMNDYWYIPDLEDYGKIRVTVYNRFGQPVYKSESYNNDWDGTWNGNPLPSASYYYIIDSSERGFIKGVVNIVR